MLLMAMFFGENEQEKGDVRSTIRKGVGTVESYVWLLPLVCKFPPPAPQMFFTHVCLTPALTNLAEHTDVPDKRLTQSTASGFGEGWGCFELTNTRRVGERKGNRGESNQRKP